MQPAASISSTALDLAKFAMWQFRLADAPEVEIMQPSTLKNLYNTQATGKNDEHDRGFGYIVSTGDESSEWAMQTE